MSESAPSMPTWIGAWAVRAAVVVLGLFVTLLAMDFFGLGKIDNPFHNWGAFWQALGIAAGICLMLGLEAFVEYKGWTVTEPDKHPKDIGSSD
jgi:hypothetical protein